MSGMRTEKPQDAPASPPTDPLTTTIAPVGTEEALIEADSMRTEYRKKCLR